MEVLVINGSPKGEKSNSFKLTQAFLEGLNESDVRIAHLSQLKISNCQGCFSCWNKTPGKCIFNDDMESLLNDLIDASLVIWSFPLYYFSVPGLLKNFIDRQLPLTLPFMDKSVASGGHPSRYDRSKQKHILISTCGFYTAKGNYDSVIGMFNYFLKDYDTIFCGQGELFRVPELSYRTNEYLSYVKQAGKEYVMSGISNATRVHLDELLFPKETFEAMADASWGIDQKTGETIDESLTFTKQMAALYNKDSYQGEDLVLEMYYTDLDQTYQIILRKDKAEVISENFRPYTTRIETPFTVWQDIASNKIRGDEALMKQMYKVQGDLQFMIHWGNYFGSSKIQSDSQKDIKKTNLKNVLIPWIFFWVFNSFHNPWYMLIVVFISLFLKYLFKNEKFTKYDEISKNAVILLCELSLLGMSNEFVLPLSYLIFGLIWLLSTFTAIPLTAYYSMNDYGGDGMLENPIFIKTNVILTRLWGILYILTGCWTYYYINTSFFSTIIWINNILPIFAGIFTLWFQKWYPEKIMQGKQKSHP